MYAPSESVLNALRVIGIAIENCWKKNGKGKFIFIALGIILTFVYVGYLQEKIMSGCYGVDTRENCKHGDKFKFELTLVLIKNIFGLTFVEGIRSNIILRSEWMCDIGFVLLQFHI